MQYLCSTSHDPSAQVLISLEINVHVTIKHVTIILDYFQKLLFQSYYVTYFEVFCTKKSIETLVFPNWTFLSNPWPIPYWFSYIPLIFKINRVLVDLIRRQLTKNEVSSSKIAYLRGIMLFWPFLTSGDLWYSNLWFTGRPH